MCRRVPSRAVACLFASLLASCSSVGNDGLRGHQSTFKPVETVNWSIFDKPYFEVAAIGRKSKGAQRYMVRLLDQPIPSYQLQDPDRTDCSGYTSGADGCYENHLSVPTRRSGTAFEYDITSASPAKTHIMYVSAGAELVVLAREDGVFAIVLSRHRSITQEKQAMAQDILSENGFDPQELKVVKQ